MHPKMIIRLCVFLVAIVATVSGCDRGAKPSDVVPSYIFVVVHHDDNDAHIEFEGDALVKQNSAGHAILGSKDLTFRFVAMRLPPGEGFMIGGLNDHPKHHVIEFTGSITRPEEDQLRLQGNLVTKTPVIIRFVKMLSIAHGDQDEFPEMSFGPGRHAVNFEGKITGWWMPDSATPDMSD